MTRVADHPAQDKAAGLPAEKLGGRYVTTYNPDVALQIIERIVEGETINAICVKGSGFPHPVTFKRWVVNNPQLAKAVDAARQLSAQSLEEEALDLSREIRRSQRDGTQVRAYEVALGQLRWSAERRDPAKFGTKAPVNIRIPIQINTTLDMGADAQSAALDKGIYTLDARVNVVPDNAIDEAQSLEFTEPLVEARPIGVKSDEKASKNGPGPAIRLPTYKPSRQSWAFLSGEEESRDEERVKAESEGRKEGDDPV